MQASKYHFELWSRDGVLLADLAGRAKNRRIVQSRNEAEEIIWQLDLNEFERYAANINADVNTLLVTNQTEVRVRRGQNYLCGGQLVYKNTRITKSSQDIEVRARGFLDLFDSRYTAEPREFTATEATTIASTLITESQAQTNGSFGVTIGSLATVGTHDKTFNAVKVKEALQRCAVLFNFDFEFTYNKVFNTYAALGSIRPEIVFEYPGTILELGAPEDGTRTINQVYVLGSGSGDEGNVRVTRSDLNSQLDYALREERVTYSEVEDTTDLSNHGDAYLAAWSRPFQVPDLVADGNRAPFVTDYGVGDYVTVRCTRYDSLAHLNGLYRVERRTIEIDENDNETVTLEVSQ